MATKKKAAKKKVAQERKQLRRKSNLTFLIKVPRNAGTFLQ